jgi:hypothetical protein
MSVLQAKNPDKEVSSLFVIHSRPITDDEMEKLQSLGSVVEISRCHPPIPPSNPFGLEANICLIDLTNESCCQFLSRIPEKLLLDTPAIAILNPCQIEDKSDNGFLTHYKRFFQKITTEFLSLETIQSFAELISVVMSRYTPVLPSQLFAPSNQTGAVIARCIPLCFFCGSK